MSTTTVPGSPTSGTSKGGRPAESTERIQDAPASEAQERKERLVTRRVACGRPTVGVRRLRDCGRELGVPRCNPEDVTAGYGEAPDREPGRTRTLP